MPLKTRPLPRPIASRKVPTPECFCLFSSVRQIWPPTAGLSSTRIISPGLAAVAAAASPAGPPPMIKSSVDVLFTRHDLHSIFNESHAATLMSNTVYRHSAFKTNSHSAKRTALIAADRAPKCRLVQSEDRRGDGCTFDNRDRLFVYGKCDQCAWIVLEGEYGSAGITGSRPIISSVNSSAVPRAVVMPSPSWPAAA